MRFREENAVLDEHSFQIFLGALLCVEADGVKIWRVSDCGLAGGGLKVALGLLHPLKRFRAHKA